MVCVQEKLLQAARVSNHPGAYQIILSPFRLISVIASDVDPDPVGSAFFLVRRSGCIKQFLGGFFRRKLYFSNLNPKK